MVRWTVVVINNNNDHDLTHDLYNICTISRVLTHTESWSTLLCEVLNQIQLLGSVTHDD